LLQEHGFIFEKYGNPFPFPADSSSNKLNFWFGNFLIHCLFLIKTIKNPIKWRGQEKNIVKGFGKPIQMARQATFIKSL